MNFKPSFFAIQLSRILFILATAVAANPAFASSTTNEIKIFDPQPNELIQPESLPIQQVANFDSNISQNSKAEINPTEQDIQLLKGLSDRYRCISADRKDQISRDNYVEQLALCLNNLEEKLAQDSGAVRDSDLAEIKKMVSNFQGDATTLNERIQKIETKLAQNSSSSFSTTTKLSGEVIIGLNTFGGAPNTTTSGGSGTTVTDRVRLNLNTTFDGQDLLWTRIEARNTAPFNTAVTGTNLTRLGWDGDDGNAAFIPKLQYSRPIDSNAKVIVDAFGGEFNDNFYNFNSLFSSAGTGSISRFGRFNPVYRLSGLGTGANLEYKFGNRLTASLGYAVPGTGSPLTSIAANPADGNGVFGGSNVVFSQLRYQASPSLDLGLIYARSYHSDGNQVSASTGSAFANRPFGSSAAPVPTSANHYSILASAKLSPGFVLSGWAGLANANAEDGTGRSADLFNFAVSAGFPNFGAKGNTLGFIFGLPPRVTRNSVANRVDRETPLHLETLYKVKVSESLDITPGLLLIMNPDTSTRNTEYVGTIRTTFKF